MADEPGYIPPISVREGGPEKREEEEEKKRAGAVISGGRGSGAGSFGSSGSAAGRSAIGGLGEAGATAEAGGLMGRLLSPVRFLQKAFSLGLVEGTKFALRNVVVQGLLAGLAVAVIAGVFMSPGGDATGRPGGTGVFASNSGGVAPQEVRGEGLHGSIPGIYERIKAQLFGAPSPEPPQPEASAEVKPEGDTPPPGETPPGENTEEAAAKAGRGKGSASPFLTARLEKLANLFGAGSGGGGGAGGSGANLAVGGKPGSAAAGGRPDPRAATTGRLDKLKGRAKVPIRQGRNQGVLNARDARGQLKNAQLASGLAGKAADGQGAASMAALPFDGAKVPGGSVQDAPGGGIGPWVPPGQNLNNTPGPSDLNGGDPTPSPTPTPPGTGGCPTGQIRGPDGQCKINPCGEGKTIGANGQCIPDPCGDGMMADTTGKCVKLSNVSPYQNQLDEAARLAGEGQAKIDGAKKFLWIAAALWAAAALILFAPALAKGKGNASKDQLTKVRQARVDAAQAAFDADVKANTTEAGLNLGALNKDLETALTAAKESLAGVDKAVEAGGKTGFFGRMTAATAIAGFGFMFFNMYQSNKTEGEEALAEARALADEVKEQYAQTDQAGRMTSATDTQCTVDGRPKIRNPESCGYKPDMTSNELRDYVKCMTAPVCTPSSGS
ncbi:MAG: hypothetical protein HY553_07420 [Elusimicrobia bacterium]|nr:hypothetical protein [Elusimicrobiota bacterium]